MRALVVFESMFGNTETLAKEIAAGLSRHMNVDIAEVSNAPHCVGEDLRLLVVGGPTHVFGLSRASTRDAAAKQADTDIVSTGEGLRAWLDSVHKGLADVAAVTFDTRVRKLPLPGSAARGAENRLRRNGFRIIAPAMTFSVDNTAGPLSAGEQQRARQWAEHVAAFAR